jgi:hypothetical protein
MIRRAWATSQNALPVTVITCGSREFELLGLRLKGAFHKQKAARLSGVTAFWDCVCLHSRLMGENRTTSESGRTPDAVDLPDLSGKGDEVRGVPDELERGRPV